MRSAHSPGRCSDPHRQRRAHRRTRRRRRRNRRAPALPEHDRVADLHHRGLEVHRVQDASRARCRRPARRGRASKARRLIRAASTISPASTGREAFSTVTASPATCSIRRTSSADIVTDRSEWKKSPSLIIDTWLAEPVDQAPIECGWLRANAFTEAGARRSGVALPEHRIDCTALDRVVRGPGRLLVVGRRRLGVVRDRVPGLLQLTDRGLQLRHGCADVRGA